MILKHNEEDLTAKTCTSNIKRKPNILKIIAELKNIISLCFNEFYQFKRIYHNVIWLVF